jgi:transketolase
MPSAWRWRKRILLHALAANSSITAPGSSLGDGCLMEGISQEAIALAGHQKLNKLIVIWDDNSITIDGAFRCPTPPISARASPPAAGMCSHATATTSPMSRARSKRPPNPIAVLIACKTIIGYGSPKKAGTAKAHGEALGAEELAATKAALGWKYGPFEIPDNIRTAWLQDRRAQRGGAKSGPRA